MSADEAAARGAKVNLGDDAITALGDIPAEMDITVGGRQARLGWMHKEYSVFEGPFWVFDEQGFVLFHRVGEDYTYAPLTDAEGRAIAAAAGIEIPADGSPLSVWDRWAGALVTGPVIVFAVLMGLRRHRRQQLARG